MRLNSLHIGRVILVIALLLLFVVVCYYGIANNSSLLAALVAALGIVLALVQVILGFFNRSEIIAFFTHAGYQQSGLSQTSSPTKQTRNRLLLFFSLTLFVAVALFSLSTYLLFIPHTSVVTSANDGAPGSFRQVSNAAKAGDAITFAANLENMTLPIHSDLIINKNIRVLGRSATESSNTSVTSGFQGLEANEITIGNTDGAKIFVPQGSTVSFEHINFSASSPIIQSSFIDNQGNLTLSHCLIANNHSDGNGGGLSNLGGTLTLNDSYVFGNTSDADGSGIYNWSGLLTLNHTTLKENTAEHNGGGIYNLRGTIIIINASSINGNTAKAGDGGGIETRNGTLTITGNSEVVDNIATGDGGGIIVVSGQTQLDNTTITGNHASQRGGGIAVEPDTDNGYAGQVTTLNSTIQVNYLGAENDSSPDSNIWGQSATPGLHSTLITSKDTGVQAGTYHPEQQPQYLGPIDIDQYNKYCQKLDPGYLGASVGMTAFSISCRTSSESSADTVPLTNLVTNPFQQICASLYKIVAPETVVARLGTYNDPTSWQCYKNEGLVGHITTDIASPNVTKLADFCRSLGFEGAKLVGQTAYGWKCFSENKNSGISMATACQHEYGDKSIDVLTDYASPNSWECWKPSS